MWATGKTHRPALTTLGCEMHYQSVSGQEASQGRRQQCRPFSLTCLAICLAKPEHLSTPSPPPVNSLRD
jgi:hypothetical protein